MQQRFEAISVSSSWRQAPLENGTLARTGVPPRFVDHYPSPAFADSWNGQRGGSGVSLLISTLFGLGLLFLFDGLVRPHVRIDATRRLRTLRPRSLVGALGVLLGYIATGRPIAAIAAGLVAAAVPEMIRRSRDDRARPERRDPLGDGPRRRAWERG